MVPKKHFSLLTGTPQENSWSQTYTYTFGSTQIFIVISLSKHGVFDLPMYGNKLATDLYQELASRLPLNLSQLKSLVSKFSSPTPQLKLDLGIALIKNKQLQLVVQGNLSCLLFRRQTYSLIQSPSKVTGLTGSLQPQDTLLFVTTKLAQLIQPKLSSLLKDSHFTETLTLIIHAQTDSSQLTGFVYQLPSKSKSKLSLSFLTHLKFPAKLPKLRSPNQNRTNKLFALALIAFFFLSVSFGFLKHSQLNKTRRFQQLQQTVKQNLTQIKQLASSDPDQALTLFKTSQQLIQAYLQDHSQEGYLQPAQELAHQLQKLETDLFHFHKVNPDIYLDLNDFNSSITPNHLNLDPQNHLLAISTQNSLNLINLNDKSNLKLKLDFPNLNLDFWNRNAFILSKREVMKLSLKTHQINSVIQAGDYWQQPKFIKLYAGNIYLLDPNQGEIWKYPVLDHGYGKARRWFAAGITPNLSRVIDFQIDGKVWFLTSSGKLKVYLHGVPAKFKLNGLISKLDHPTSFFLTQTEIFILEPDHARILVFSKDDGSYLRQYLNSEFSQAKQIFIDNHQLYLWYDHYLSRFQI